MNKEEFEKYVEKNIAQLYPDAQDIPGSRVIFKVDSGPSCMNVKLLVNCAVAESTYILDPKHNCNHPRNRPIIWSLQTSVLL